MPLEGIPSEMESAVLESLLAEVESTDDDDYRGSLLITITKACDLREPKYRSLVEQAIRWTESECYQLRHAAMFALCFSRPVPGCEYLLEPLWRREARRGGICTGLRVPSNARWMSRGR